MPPYEIIATLGPASNREAFWKDMIAAGATAFRLNTSHLSLSQLEEWLEKLSRFYAAEGTCLPVALDLQGSKWRLGRLPARTLAAGQRVELVFASASQGAALPVPHADFFRAAPASSGEIVLNDAKVRLRLETARAASVTAVVMQGGPVSSNKGITFTASDFRSESLGDKDQAVLEKIRGMRFVRCAISYVKDAAEMARYRALVSEAAGAEIDLIAKIERGTAVDDAAQIARHAGELWLCRGDLGAELGLREMAAAARRFSEQVRDLPVPAILAGQVLEHMVEQPAPTRSEICMIYESLQKAYRGFVLSDETAVGAYPVDSVRAAALFF